MAHKKRPGNVKHDVNSEVHREEDPFLHNGLKHFKRGNGKGGDKKQSEKEGTLLHAQGRRAPSCTRKKETTLLHNLTTTIYVSAWRRSARRTGQLNHSDFILSDHDSHTLAGTFLSPFGGVSHKEGLAETLCESRGGRLGISVLTSHMVSVDVKQY